MNTTCCDDCFNDLDGALLAIQLDSFISINAGKRPRCYIGVSWGYLLRSL